MNRFVGFAGLLAVVCGPVHAAPPQTELAELSVKTRPNTACAVAFPMRRSPFEQLLDRNSYLVETLDSDLKGGIAGLGAHEPLCFFLLPSETLLMRDGRGRMYLFRKYPRWDEYRFPDSPVMQSNAT
jgi:hypothetical protein